MLSPPPMTVFVTVLLAFAVLLAHFSQHHSDNSLQLFPAGGILINAAESLRDEDSGINVHDIKSIHGLGKFQAYSSTSQLCYDMVIFVNVGTAMSVSEYSEISKQIVLHTPSIVAIIMDNHPGDPMKQDGKIFLKLANAIASNIAEYVPNCQTSSQQPRNGYVIGGHSAGGQGAIEALDFHDEFQFQLAGYIGLAPYAISADYDKQTVSVPSLIWDFSAESCLVVPKQAGIAAYRISSPDHRVFYQVQTSNDDENDPKSGGPHCSFANHGCAIGMCEGESELRGWIHQTVGMSVRAFHDAIISKQFDKESFEAVLRAPTNFDFLHGEMVATPEVKLYANRDRIATSHSVSNNGETKTRPIWPSRWSANFQTEFWSTKGHKKSNNTGAYYYDFEEGRSLTLHGPGQQDNWCACASPVNSACKIISFSASTDSTGSDQTAVTYAVMPDEGICCTLLDGIGPVDPAWLNKAKHTGNMPYGWPERSCDKWTNPHPGDKLMMKGDSWLVDDDGIPCGYIDEFRIWARDLWGLAHSFALDNTTFNTAAINPEVFDLPDNGKGCEKPCPNRNDEALPWCR